MFQAQARWLLLAGLTGSSLLACSDEATPDTTATAGASSGGSAGSSPQTAGSSGSGGGSSSAGSMSTSGSGGAATAGSGGAATAGSGGAATAGSGGAATAGSGGAATAGSGGASGSGGGSAGPTAVANIMGVGTGTGKVMGTATFTQGAEMTKLVISLTACPAGEHASHLHETKDCGNNGTAAGNHWVGNGENLGNYTCADNKVTHEVSKPKAMWTVGDGSATDVTKYSFMVHEMGDNQPGGRIGCGVINAQ